MGFSEKQVNALRRKLDGAFVHNREFQGRTLSYIEGWHAIAEANRIFGFDGWDRETVESRCVLDRENDGGLHAVYVAKVRITVRAEGKTVLREGYGTGEAHGSSAGVTHEKALKTAETDATKRALATFGKPFGLALYVSPRNGRERGVDNPLPGAPPIPDHARRRTKQRVGRNGRYFVPPRAKVILDPASPPSGHPERAAAEGARIAVPIPDQGTASASTQLPPVGGSAGLKASAKTGDQPQTPIQIGSPPLQPPTAEAEPSETGADTPRLLIDWPKRRRDPEHLKYVRTQPCLICSRTPSDAHHLRFAQSRGISLKVSDEFTVPLCRVHHDQLHQSGKEIDWWSAMDRDIDPLAIARTLWEESQAKVAAGEPQPDSLRTPSPK
jgi:DNA recombination protein Rad52